MNVASSDDIDIWLKELDIKTLEKAEAGKWFFLMKYDEGWREELEDGLLRNFIAKEKLVELSDETFNKIIHALEGYQIEKITTLDILRMVQERYPEVVEELEDLL